MMKKFEDCVHFWLNCVIGGDSTIVNEKIEDGNDYLMIGSFDEETHEAVTQYIKNPSYRHSAAVYLCKPSVIKTDNQIEYRVDIDSNSSEFSDEIKNKLVKRLKDLILEDLM